MVFRDLPSGYDLDRHEKEVEAANRIQAYWKKQMSDIENSTDLKSHGLPLQRIKKIMKSDEEIKAFVIIS